MTQVPACEWCKGSHHIPHDYHYFIHDEENNPDADLSARGRFCYPREIGEFEAETEAADYYEKGFGYSFDYAEEVSVIVSLVLSVSDQGVAVFGTQWRIKMEAASQMYANVQSSEELKNQNPELLEANTCGKKQN